MLIPERVSGCTLLPAINPFCCNCFGSEVDLDSLLPSFVGIALGVKLILTAYSLFCRNYCMFYHGNTGVVAKYSFLYSRQSFIIQSIAFNNISAVLAVVLNIGTSVQLAMLTKDPQLTSADHRDFDIVPFFHNRLLKVVAGLNGGNVLSVLLQYVRSWFAELGMACHCLYHYLTPGVLAQWLVLWFSDH